VLLKYVDVLEILASFDDSLDHCFFPFSDPDSRVYKFHIVISARVIQRGVGYSMTKTSLTVTLLVRNVRTLRVANLSLQILFLGFEVVLLEMRVVASQHLLLPLVKERLPLTLKPSM
jgi:hypothetical protein